MYTLHLLYIYLYSYMPHIVFIQLPIRFPRFYFRRGSILSVSQPRGFKVFGGKRWSMAVDDIHGRMDGRFLDDNEKFAGAPKMG